MLESSSQDSDFAAQKRLAENFTRALQASNVKPKAIAEALEVTEQAVSNWKRSGKIKARFLPVIARMLGTTVEALQGAEPPTSVVAHDMSQSRLEHAPEVTWGDLMKAEELPALFWVALPDDSMAPRAGQGRMICFDTTMQPVPGDGVLVRDHAGALYFRQYRAGAAGRWTAHALNPAYAEMDSQRDGLAVVAVLKAEEGRWSA